MASCIHRALPALAGLLLLCEPALAADPGVRDNQTLRGTTMAANALPDAGRLPWITPVSSQLSAPVQPTFDPGTRLGDRIARDALAVAMREALGGVLLGDSPALTHTALIGGQAMAARLHASLDTTQVVLLVDRAPAVQRLWVVIATPGRPWEQIGSVRVSTGKPGRKEHFRTPVGVFVNDTGIVGYRALGTYNENHIRGNGTKGMRVWDFGWQTTDDWRTKGFPMAVRMEMHATDPANMESRLGRWDSEGCIRIPSKFNTFIDQRGLIDARLRAAATAGDRRFAALLPKGGRPSALAGSVVVVIDSSDPGAAPSDPVRANLMEHPVTPPVEHEDAG